MMLLLLLWRLLLLLVVMVMWGGGGVGSGLASSRREGAWMGIVVGEEAAIGRRWRGALAPHSLGWERRLGVLGRLVGDGEACGGREGVGITGQGLGGRVLGGRRRGRAG